MLKPAMMTDGAPTSAKVSHQQMAQQPMRSRQCILVRLHEPRKGVRGGVGWWNRSRVRSQLPPMRSPQMSASRSDKHPNVMMINAKFVISPGLAAPTVRVWNATLDMNAKRAVIIQMLVTTVVALEGTTSAGKPRLCRSNRLAIIVATADATSTHVTAYASAYRVSHTKKELAAVMQAQRKRRSSERLLQIVSQAVHALLGDPSLLFGSALLLGSSIG
mmetsp:Transcript_9077/g.23753  ORF Transcript_9077/g.23753 Transcript_9077/m.23753 type:complete len:218 (-) Transcript_9077:55-708(-)